jgi:hypothetical protein
LETLPNTITFIAQSLAMLKHPQISIALDALKAIFIFLFVYTAVSKLLDFQSFSIVLRHSPLIGKTAPVIAILLPVTELVVSLLLLLPRTLKLGLYSFLSLLILFTLYLVYMLSFSPSLPCTCGGVFKYMSWHHHLTFNLVFISLAVLATRLYHKKNKPVSLINKNFIAQ